MSERLTFPSYIKMTFKVKQVNIKDVPKTRKSFALYKNSCAKLTVVMLNNHLRTNGHTGS